MGGANADCSHDVVSCLNPYDLVRKYRCSACAAVMMCQCDEERGRRFLPHQLHEAQELESKIRVPVTHGFVSTVCPECRGQRPIPYPKAAIHGETTKIRRYYWRELFFLKRELLADGNAASKDEAERLALDEIKRQHEASPKYDMQEESEASFLSRIKVAIENARGRALHGGKVQLDSGDEVSPESFAELHLRQSGYEVMFCESTPWHALFAVLLWMLIQNPSDPRVRIVGFGDRVSFEQNGKSGEIVYSHLPEDFGGSMYTVGRETAIDEEFASLRIGGRETLLFAFDLGIEGSFGLRQYLWAHRQQDLARARQLLCVLPPEVVLTCLRYLLDSYWANYLGWPDLLAWRGDEFLFVEVKLSADKLSAEQRHWIEQNEERLGLPFRLFKIHRDGERKPTKRT